MDMNKKKSKCRKLNRTQVALLGVKRNLRLTKKDDNESFVRCSQFLTI